MSTTSNKQPKDPRAKVIADILWERLKEYQSPPQHFTVLRQRIEQLLREYTQECVLAVGYALIDEAQREWNIGKISAASFAYMHDRLNIPAGAWMHYLWLQEEIKASDPRRLKVRYGLVYWLDLLADSLSAGDHSGATEARAGLKLLTANWFSTRPGASRALTREEPSEE